MIAPLLGIPALINTLLNRLTAQRAANLDNIGNLGNLDVAVSTRLGAAVKLVQRGQFTSYTPGSVSLGTPVNTQKAFVISESKGSSGYVAARGVINGTLSPSGNKYFQQTETSPYAKTFASYQASNDLVPSYSGERSLSGGTTDLTVKTYSAYLVNANSVYCDGPCNWQVIEFY